MGCGCNKKKKVTAVQESVDYTPNGGGTVRLGLKDTIHLPVKLPGAINGQDIVVVANKKQQAPNLQATVGSKPAIVIVGRNALVDVDHKQQMLEKWPSAFNG